MIAAWSGSLPGFGWRRRNFFSSSSSPFWTAACAAACISGSSVVKIERPSWEIVSRVSFA